MNVNHQDAKAPSIRTLLLLSALASWWLIAPAARASEQKPYVGDMKVHVTKYEDTLPEIARANDIGFNELRSANPYVDPWMPGKDVKMVIPSRHILPYAVHKGIVINLPEMRLYVYNASGQLIQTHPIGVGREGLSTPVGHTTVVRKVVGPIWRPTPRMLKEHPELPPEVGPGPDNPMGTHAMYLGWAQYAIHGTDKPYAIGRRASSGCIRMYPEDIKAVYPAVPVGESVTVVNQPVKAAWIDGRLYLEAHPPLDQAMMIEEDGGHPYYDMTDDDMAEIMRVAGSRADLIDWNKVRSTIRNREGYPVAVAEDPALAAHTEPAPQDDGKDIVHMADKAGKKDAQPDDKKQAVAQDGDDDASATVDITPPDAKADDAAKPVDADPADIARADTREKPTVALKTPDDAPAAKAAPVSVKGHGKTMAKADVKTDVGADVKTDAPKHADKPVHKKPRDLDDPSNMPEPAPVPAHPKARESTPAPAPAGESTPDNADPDFYNGDG